MLKRQEISILNIIFERVYKNHERVNIQTISIETLEFVFSLYRIKTREGFPLKFSFNGKQLNPKLSLVDAGLSDNSIIITDICEETIINFDILEPYITLYFEIHWLKPNFSTNLQTISIKVKPNISVGELISLFLLKTGGGCHEEFKFIFKSRELFMFPEMSLAYSGLENGSKIIVKQWKIYWGAGYPSWDYKEINIKFIKISKSTKTNTNIFNVELTSLLKLCLLKEISSKFDFLYCNDKRNELEKKLPDLIFYILQILRNGFVISQEIKKTITEVIQKEGGDNIINFSKFVDKVVDKNEIYQVMKLLNNNDFKEINDIGFFLSKYNEHITLFNN